MLLSNLGSIISRNFTSLVNESRGTGLYAKSKVFVTFVAVPFGLAVLFGLMTPIWTDFLGAMFSMVAVLTGFSINSLVLLNRHSQEDTYEAKTEVVNQTKDFSLYSILSGVVLLITLTLGYLIVESSLPQIIPSDLSFPITLLEGVSILVYFILAHYLAMLLVITHRLYTLVHTDALT